MSVTKTLAVTRLGRPERTQFKRKLAVARAVDDHHVSVFAEASDVDCVPRRAVSKGRLKPDEGHASHAPLPPSETGETCVQSRVLSDVNSRAAKSRSTAAAAAVPERGAASAHARRGGAAHSSAPAAFTVSLVPLRASGGGGGSGGSG